MELKADYSAESVAGVCVDLCPPLFYFVRFWCNSCCGLSFGGFFFCPARVSRFVVFPPTATSLCLNFTCRLLTLLHRLPSLPHPCCPVLFLSQGWTRGFPVRLVRRGAPPGGVELGALRGLRQEPAFREVALFQRRSGAAIQSV